MSDKPDGPVSQVFEYWVKAMKKTASTKLTVNRKKKIAARLKEGYSVDDILKAIDGCARSPHHMGANDTGSIYDDLELICRSGEKLEQFMNNYKGSSNAQSGGLTGHAIGDAIGEEWLREEAEKRAESDRGQDD